MAQQAADHLLAAGDRLRLQLIEGGARGERLGVHRGQVEPGELRQFVRFPIIVHATEQNTEPSHG
jgi:hypothetical protein